MADPVSESEGIKKAVKWISDELKFDPDLKRSELISKACIIFDLSPLEAEFLSRFRIFENDQN